MGFRGICTELEPECGFQGLRWGKGIPIRREVGVGGGAEGWSLGTSQGLAGWACPGKGISPADKEGPQTWPVTPGRCSEEERGRPSMAPG